MIEDILIVVVRCKIAATIVGGSKLRPIYRVEEDPAYELTLNVLLQKTGLEILKDSISEKPVVGRGKTPAGNAEIKSTESSIRFLLPWMEISVSLRVSSTP